MRLAEHLAVLYRGLAAFAPGGHVVGIHFGQFPDAGLVDAALQHTMRAVADTFLLGFACLRA